MAKHRLYYDWANYSNTGECCEAHLEINKDIYLICSGKTFEEAKAKVIKRARMLPPDEEVEI